MSYDDFPNFSDADSVDDSEYMPVSVFKATEDEVHKKNEKF